MKGYGQFCPLAIASEIVGERWTPLVLRELMLGARRFNHIHRGVPRMSPSLLSRRLDTLEKAGVIERARVDGHTEYVLTTAGRELLPTIESLACWGKRWLPATLSEDRADPDLILWDMHRRMDLERLPEARTVIEFEFLDRPPAMQRRWLVGDRSGMEMCITDPGYEVDLLVRTDCRTIILVWYGDIPLPQAIDRGAIRLHGSRELCRDFPSWLQLSPIAGVRRERP